MPVRHSRVVPARTRQRRKLVWATFDNSFNLPASGTIVNTIDLLNQFELAGASKLGLTVIRTHMRILLPYAPSTVRYELGLSIVRQTDVGTVRPNPNGDNDLDWMLFDKFFPSFSGATVNASMERVIDLKAKRKCEEMGQTYGASFWSNTAAPGTIEVFARTLVALP
jgi:hypothetical protein